MAPTKQNNLLIQRKKFCDNCHRWFYASRTVGVKCPYCCSRKVHFKNGRDNRLLYK